MVDWLTKLTRKAAHTRREERTVTTLPVRIGSKEAGLTRDMSASGAYFETDMEYKVGSAIEFAIEFQGMDGNMTTLACFGRIVRVEPRGAGKVGIAVKISQRNLKTPVASRVPANREKSRLWLGDETLYDSCWALEDAPMRPTAGEARKMSLINKMLQDLDKRGAEPAGAKIREVEAIEIQDEPKRRGGMYAGIAIAVLAVVGAGYWFFGAKLMREDRVAMQPPQVAPPAPKPATPAPPPPVISPAPAPEKAQPEVSVPAPTVAAAAPQSPSPPSVAATKAEPVPTAPPAAKEAVPVPPTPTQPPAVAKAAPPEPAVKPVAVAAAPVKALAPVPIEAKETMPPPPPPAAVPKRAPERAATTQASGPQTNEPDTYRGNISIERQARAAPTQQRASVDYRTGLDYMNQGRVEQAAATFSEVLSQDPRHYAARQALVTLLLERGRIADAQRTLREGLDAMPENSSWAMLLARLQVEEGDPATATETLKKHIGPAQNRADYQAFLGTVLQLQGRHQEAIGYYEVATKLSPGYGAWLTGLAMSLEEEKRKSEAVDAYKRAYASNTLAPSMRSFVEGKLKQLQ